MAPLTAERTWRGFYQLLLDMGDQTDRRRFAARALDWLIDSLGADRAALAVRGSGGVLTVTTARRDGREMTPAERFEMSESVLMRSLVEDRLVVQDSASGESDTPKSFFELSIRSAVATPLRSSGRSGGALREALYVDYRRLPQEVTAVHRELISAVATLLGTAQAPHSVEEAAPTKAAVGRAETPTLGELLAAPGLVGMRSDIESAMAMGAPMLILGESGTGKTLLARAIAAADPRRPIVRAMLGASDDMNTIASELFGHERGAFSGATGKRVGLVEHADGGTLILDEVLNLPPHAQQMLLDFTQFGTYRPLGHSRREPKRSQLQIIAVTNGDLLGAVRSGRFREDLYHRLAGAVLTMPRLADRRGDIPQLAARQLLQLAPQQPWRLSVAARRWLVCKERSWSGNLRELEALLRRAIGRARISGRSDFVLHVDDLVECPDAHPAAGHGAVRSAGVREVMAQVPVNDVRGVGTPATENDTESSIETRELSRRWAEFLMRREYLLEEERALVAEAVRKRSGVLAHAAQDLGMPRTTLISRMRRLEISRDGW